MGPLKRLVRHMLRLKDLQDLTADDFLRCAVWERIYEGGWLTDEETVRARPGISVVNGREDYMVRTEYRRADGTLYRGFCTPQPAEGVDGPSTGVWPLFRMHHTLFVGDNVVELDVWPDSPFPHDRAAYKYEILDATAERLFPITFQSQVHTTGLPLTGTLEGFCRSPDVGRAEFVR